MRAHPEIAEAESERHVKQFEQVLAEGEKDVGVRTTKVGGGVGHSHTPQKGKTVE